MFLEFADILQMSAFPRERFSHHFRRFTRVAARLLHKMVAGFLVSNSSPVVLLYVWWSADVSVWAASRTHAYGSWIQPPSTWLSLLLAAVLAH
jgi:hypothetical protein